MKYKRAMRIISKQYYTRQLLGGFSSVQRKCLFIFLACFIFNFSCKRNKPQHFKPHFERPILIEAENYFDVNEYARGIRYFDSAYAVIPHKDFLDIWSHYIIKAQYFYWAKPEPHVAQLYVDSMLMLLKDHEQEYGTEYLRTLMLNGDILMSENKYGEAYKMFYDGSLFAKKNLDRCSSCELINRMGSLKIKQGDYLGAVAYFKKSMAASTSCPLESRANSETWILNVIGVCYKSAHLPDSAVYYFKTNLDTADRYLSLLPQQSKYLIAIKGFQYLHLGEVYIDSKDYMLAEVYLKKSIAINNRPNYSQNAAKVAQLRLAGLYIKSSRLGEANNLLKAIEKDLKRWQAEGRNMGELMSNLLKLQWEYFDKIKNTHEAYNAFKRYKILQDSTNSANQLAEAVDLDEGLKRTAQQYKIQLLSKNNELKTTYLSAIIVFSVLTLIILVMAWYSLKRSRKNVHELTGLNKLISDYNMQMQSSLTALEQSYEENANIIKIVAHDLRAPIGGITIAVSKMLEKPNRSENDQSMLRLIQASGKDSLALTSDLLKTHSGSKEIKKEPVAMYSLLTYCVSFMRLKAEEKGQTIELDAGHFTAFVNRGNIWRVICNLIANAIKFSPPGTTIKVLMLKKEDNVLITVDDCGIGIPDNMQDKIFDMFTEAKRRGTKGEQPFGIGLAISKQIVEMHGGKIWFEDKKPIAGTMFHVELPIQYLN